VLHKFYDYEKSLPSEKRAALGIVYTPIEVVEYINKRALALWDQTDPPRVMDPCVGTGIFLYDMANRISHRWDMSLDEVYEKCIFGNDVDEEALLIARSLMPRSNLSACDGLSLNLSEFDIVVTNPPYIRIQNLDDVRRNQLKNNYDCCKGDTDIYIAFFEKMMKSGVISGFICPNSWRKNKSSDSLRTLMANTGRVDTIIDFKSTQIFENIGTYTSIVVFADKKIATVQTGSDLINITPASHQDVFIDDVVVVDKQEQTFVREVLQREKSVFDMCDIKVGLATLCDAVFFLELISKNKATSIVKQKTAGAAPFEIENGILIKCLKGSDITKNLDKKYVIIYPYDRGSKALPESHLKEHYPLAFSYLEAHKNRLLKRDKGKKKPYTWHSFGRTQALSLALVNKVVFSPMIKEKMSFKDCAINTTFISGYCLVPKEGHSLAAVQEVFSSDEIKKWIKIFGKNMAAGWIGVSKTTFSKYKLPPSSSTRSSDG